MPFAERISRRIQENVLDRLLRYRAAAVSEALFGQVVFHCLFQCVEIDAIVLVEARILGNDDGANDAWRNRVDRNRVPAQFRPIRVAMLFEFVTTDKARSLDRPLGVKLPVGPDSDQVTDVHYHENRQDAQAPAQRGRDHGKAEP